MILRVAILTVLTLALASETLDAQRRRRGPRFVEPIPSWGIESSIRISVLKDDAVSYVGARIGRQLDSSLNLGIGGSMLLTANAESVRADGFDRVTSLIYLGPSIELRDSLRGPVRFLVRTGAVLGLVGYEESSEGRQADGIALMYGFEPELGVVARVTRVLQVTATVGALLAWRMTDGHRVVSGPTASFGVRLVR